MKAALCVALFLTSAGAARSVNAAPSFARLEGGIAPAIRVAVFTSPDVSESIVNSICSETEAIWGPAGIAFDWRRSPSTNLDRTWRLEVTIDDRRRDVTSWQEALGWITFTAGGPNPSIHLSHASAEHLFLRESYAHDGTVATHDAEVGRALGRALSHELGHYLLHSKAHTPRGLMRATWPSDELFAAWRGGFELTAEQRTRAVLAISRVR